MNEIAKRMFARDLAKAVAANDARKAETQPPAQACKPTKNCAPSSSRKPSVVAEWTVQS